MRLSNEDGFNAGARNLGRFWLFAIPMVLGLGASLWLGFYIGVHDFRRELSQEDRAAVAVGAGARPKGKITFDLESMQKYCGGIFRADIQGDELRLYAKNDCGKALSDMWWYYDMLSPDGTVLHHDELMKCSTPARPYDSGECRFWLRTSIVSDDRVASVRAWTVPKSY